MPYYVHDVPGRLRIKIPSLKRNAIGARKLRALLSRVDGVCSATVNQMTGSILVNYDKNVTHSSELLMLLNRQGYIDAEKVTPSEQMIDREMKKLGKVAFKALVGIVLDRALQGSPLSILTAFI
jgi:hypothetical protein